MKAVPGICDKCGLRYKLKDLRQEYILGRGVGNRVCKWCWDASHPQLDTRKVRTDDKQSVRNSRSDKPELAASREFYGFSPFVGGNEATSTATIEQGSVKVELGPT